MGLLLVSILHPVFVLWVHLQRCREVQGQEETGLGCADLPPGSSDSGWVVERVKSSCAKGVWLPGRA